MNKKTISQFIKKVSLYPNDLKCSEKDFMKLLDDSGILFSRTLCRTSGEFSINFRFNFENMSKSDSIQEIMKSSVKSISKIIWI